MPAYNHQHRLPLLCLLLASTSIHSNAQLFKIVLWGDLPYRGTRDDVFDPTDEEQINGVSVGVLYAELRDSINDSNAPFAFHAGDVKSGRQPCYTSKYFDRFEQLANSLDMPVVFTPGDNDWTDCHNDIESFRWTTQKHALENVRDRFYSNRDDAGPILGSNTDAWSIQVTTEENANYPELQRFMYNEIMFVVVHVVGGNNNRQTTCFNWFDTSFSCPFSLFLTDLCCFGARWEYNARNSKVNEFLQQSFGVAAGAGAKGVVVLAQAAIFNLDDEPFERFTDGFFDFWHTLRTETLSFGKPVVYVHGDAHRFKDYIPDIDGVPSNLQALMVPGADEVGWVEATINPDASPVFSFELIDIANAP